MFEVLYNIPIALVTLAVWLLGLSYTAGTAMQRQSQMSKKVRNLEHRLDKQDMIDERLARIETDIKWLKRYFDRENP